MSKILSFPEPESNPEALEVIVARVNKLAEDSSKVWLSQHAKDRMLERNITSR